MKIIHLANAHPPYELKYRNGYRIGNKNQTSEVIAFYIPSNQTGGEFGPLTWQH